MLYIECARSCFAVWRQQQRYMRFQQSASIVWAADKSDQVAHLEDCWKLESQICLGFGARRSLHAIFTPGTIQARSRRLLSAAGMDVAVKQQVRNTMHQAEATGHRMSCGRLIHSMIAGLQHGTVEATLCGRRFHSHSRQCILYQLGLPSTAF